MYPMTFPTLGERRAFPFPDWQIDSTDSDPVVWSREGSRWNYQQQGKRTFWAEDRPSPLAPFEAAPAVSDLKFQVRLYCAEDVPRTANSASELPEPLETVEWEDSTCWEHGKEPTHPGFGRPCPWQQASAPGEEPSPE